MVERLRRLREWPLAGSRGLWRSMASASGEPEDVAMVVLRSRALAAFPAALREKWPLAALEGSGECWAC